MEQTASKERAMFSFTKRKGQTTYKVNVFFAENTTATFEDKHFASDGKRYCQPEAGYTGCRVIVTQINCF